MPDSDSLPAAAVGTTGGGPAIVEVADLVFDYPTARALFGVSLTIAPGTITALVGPNGAGKTTMMRCLAALETPYSGSVHIDGLDIEDHPREIHKRIGFLQDFFGLYDDLTVRQCLDYHAAAHGMGRAARAQAVPRGAERLGLSGRLEQKAGTLSRGLRQRLAVAQAIIHDPRLVLLDEPASGLDPEARESLSRLLVTLRDGGMTLIVSSHILAELEDYSTHMMIMRDGRITEHSAIGGADVDHLPPAVRMRVELSAPDPALGDVLTKAVAVSGVAIDGTVATFDFAGADPDRTGLLRQLLESGVPVTAFHPVQRSMQDVYLDHLRRDRGGNDGDGGDGADDAGADGP